MNLFTTILVGAAALGFLIWLMIPSRETHSIYCGQDGGATGGGDLIDPSDSYQIGLLIGLYGGDIEDAAIARYALKRFEETHGRKATTNDVGVVVGLMSAGAHHL